MSLPVVRAYFALLRLEPFLARENFAGLHDLVRRQRTHVPQDTKLTTEQLCHAIDSACVWYWKQVLCLQRSAATVTLLRNYGVEAQLVIGAQLMPFQAHAWVEVDGRVVNDNSYTNEVYAVLDRC